MATTQPPQMTQQQQMLRIYEACERPVKLWIAKFLHEDDLDELFDVVPEKARPYIFWPNKHTDGKYLEFSLGVVPPTGDETLLSLNDEIMVEGMVRGMVDFLIYSTKIAYGTTVKTLQKTERTEAHDVELEWNGCTYTFEPRYCPDIKRENDQMRFYHNNMMAAKDKIPEEKLGEWEKDFNELTAKMKEIADKMKEKNVWELIDSKSKDWVNFPRLGIKARLIEESELPKREHSKEVVKVSDKCFEDSESESGDSDDSDNESLEVSSDSEDENDDEKNSVENLAEEVEELKVDLNIE